MKYRPVIFTSFFILNYLNLIDSHQAQPSNSSPEIQSEITQTANDMDQNDEFDVQYGNYQKQELNQAHKYYNTMKRINNNIFSSSERYSSFSDFLYTLVIFGLGVLFSIFIGVTKGRQSKQIDALINQIQGQKGVYEQAKQKCARLQSFLYRLKTAEKIGYTVALIVATCMYKSKELYKYVVLDRGMITIPLLVGSILILRWIIDFYEQKYHNSKKRLKELKNNETDQKRSLISQMDPVIVETLREIVSADMKQEF